MASQRRGIGKLEKAVTFDNEVRPLTTREKLVLAEAELERRRRKTSTNTQERLAELGAQLEEEYQKPHKGKTSHLRIKSSITKRRNIF